MNQPIRQRAMSQSLVLDEDASLFRTSIVNVIVDVTPHRRRTANGDCIFRGFIGEKEIEVVIPASRQDAILPLIKFLQSRLQAATQGKSSAMTAAAGALRQKLRIDGVWRARMLTETDGIPERRFQLVAARWRFRGSDGQDSLFGYLPSQ